MNHPERVPAQAEGATGGAASTTSGRGASGHHGPQLRVPPLAEIVLAILAPGANPPVQGASGEAAWLAGLGDAVDRFAGTVAAATHGRIDAVRIALGAWQRQAPPSDRYLHALAGRDRLSLPETAAIALACAGEMLPMAARALIWLQHPVGEARPTLGLLATLCEGVGEPDALARLAEGTACRNGVLQLLPDDRPLCERSVRVPLGLILALGGHEGRPDNVDMTEELMPVLSASVIDQAHHHAHGLKRDGARVLVVRSGLAAEARAAAAQVAQALGCRAAYVDGEIPRGLGTWLWLRERVPVLCQRLGPGERFRLPVIPGYDGPVLVAAGADGSVEASGAVAHWRVPVPPAAERAVLWRAALGERVDVESLASTHRHSAGRIAELGQAARSAAARAGTTLRTDHVAQAARAGVGADLGALAELLADDIPDAALVLTAYLRDALDALLARCRVRDGLADGLGISARARYKPGVRGLLVGPSGTGKTLAAGWIATRLGLPLYRVDLASVTSKYIGETEKNLAELFARAEHAEVVLLFDEADSLFGKRTDVKDANDRFANQQTNYLLQRIESYEGITLLTSNSRARFDSAFTRRLDAIIEFPAPGPEERRALWLAHLGEEHVLDAAALNRLAAACDLAGGHIRNAVFCAAALARQGNRSLGEDDLLLAVAAEYRKLGKPAPALLGVVGDGGRS
ncbi:MAG: ATP-binding protein [Betaproteobacteria bacterium]|nr:MAG: ATP-binding protein [Betaproteobacteria bacterium]